MDTQEFYVRNESDTDARGPFSLEQLVTLAENDQVTAESLYYDATGEKWLPVGGNAELMAALFPEKKKLTVKPKEGIRSLNVQKESTPPITVQDMLAAAEGRTDDTKEQLDPREAQARAAGFALYTCIVLLLVSMAVLCLPSIDDITALAVAKVLANPVALLGLVDLVFALLLFLQMVVIYPLIRFRAALGLGLIGFVLWNQGANPLALLALAAGSFGLYGSTIVTSLSAWALVTAIGLAGMLGLGWFFLV